MGGMSPLQSMATAAWPVITGGLTFVVGATGYWQGWRARRREDSERLNSMAERAVRIAESRYVRPLLRQRMTGVVERHLSPSASCPLQKRALLFCQLEADVGLTDEEKGHALDVAVEALQAELRDDPAPPLALLGSGGQRARLVDAVEAAYHLRPRPAAQLIDRLAEFLGSGDGGHCCGGGHHRRRGQRCEEDSCQN